MHMGQYVCAYNFWISPTGYVFIAHKMWITTIIFMKENYHHNTSLKIKVPTPHVMGSVIAL